MLHNIDRHAWAATPVHSASPMVAAADSCVMALTTARCDMPAAVSSSVDGRTNQRPAATPHVSGPAARPAGPGMSTPQGRRKRKLLKLSMGDLPGQRRWRPHQSRAQATALCRRRSAAPASRTPGVSGRKGEWVDSGILVVTQLEFRTEPLPC